MTKIKKKHFQHLVLICVCIGKLNQNQNTKYPTVGTSRHSRYSLAKSMNLVCVCVEK